MNRLASAWIEGRPLAPPRPRPRRACRVVLAGSGLAALRVVGVVVVWTCRRGG